MSKQRAKGTMAESALITYLRDRGYTAERRTLGGARDRGDIVWFDYPWLACEVKNVRTPRYPEWSREAEAEAENAEAEVGVVVHKAHGVGLSSQGRWTVVMTLDSLIAILEKTS